MQFLIQKKHWAQGDSETEISENKQSGNFSENDKKTAEIFSEEEQQSGEEADFAVFSEENADLLTGNSEEHRNCPGY